MGVVHGFGSDADWVTATPARRGLPWAIVIATALVVLVGLLTVAVSELPWWANGQLLATVLLASRLCHEAVGQLSPVRIAIADDGITVETWVGTNAFDWHDVHGVTVHPSAGRFSDPVATELPDMALALRVSVPTADMVEQTSDLTIATVPAVDHAALVKIARRISAFQRRTLAGGMRAAIGEAAQPV